MEPVRTRFTTAAVVLIGASLAATTLAGCTSSKPSPQPSPAVIRVQVRLVYSHPAGPTMTSYDGPMRDEQVQASGESGAGGHNRRQWRRRSARTGRHLRGSSEGPVRSAEHRKPDARRDGARRPNLCRPVIAHDGGGSVR